MSVSEYLRSRHVSFQTLLHAPGPTATHRAQCVHVPGRQVAKGVLMRSGGQYSLAVLPSTFRVDTERYSEVLGLDSVVATEDEVESIFRDCERGAVPPFGQLYGLRTVLDPSLAAWAEMICVANTRHEGLRLRFRDYESLESPLRARFAVMSHPAGRSASPRRAG